MTLRRFRIVIVCLDSVDRHKSWQDYSMLMNSNLASLNEGDPLRGDGDEDGT